MQKQLVKDMKKLQNGKALNENVEYDPVISYSSFLTYGILSPGKKILLVAASRTNIDLEILHETGWLNKLLTFRVTARRSKIEEFNKHLDELIELNS